MKRRAFARGWRAIPVDSAAESWEDGEGGAHDDQDRDGQEPFARRRIRRETEDPPAFTSGTRILAIMSNQSSIPVSGASRPERSCEKADARLMPPEESSGAGFEELKPTPIPTPPQK